MPNKSSAKRIMVIPDTQIRAGDDVEYLSFIAQYAIEMKPDIIVQLGDFADMPSLSMHDKPGTKGMEGMRYQKDVASVKEAMSTLMTPIIAESERLARRKQKQWNPRLVLTLGNHEDRITRAVSNDPRLEGLIKLEDLGYEEWGWEVIPYLQPIVIDNIVFCHYMVSGVMGRPVTSARMLLTKHHQSTIVGHQQGRDIAYGKRADGTEMTGLIAGSCYEHDEHYLNHQTNNHWRGLYMLFDVDNGSFDELPISLRYLRRKYGKSE